MIYSRRWTVSLLLLMPFIRVDASSAKCVIVIDEVREYKIEKRQESWLMSKRKNIASWQSEGERLLMPRRPSGRSLEIKDLTEGSVNRQVVALKSGSEFALAKGVYQLSSPGYALTIEERLSDSNHRLSVANSTLRVFSPSKGNSIRRHITVYCYPLNTLVTVCGRVVDAVGNGVCGIELQGQPVTRDESDVMWHETIVTKTDENGIFKFKNLPPTSLDLAVRFLLFGRVMKASFPSEKIFDFSISIKHNSSFQTQREQVSVPLISKRNLSDVQYLAGQIREVVMLQKDAANRFVDEKRVVSKLPISTNDCIYVDDIVIAKKDLIIQRK